LQTSPVARDVADIVLVEDSLAALLPRCREGRWIISGIAISAQVFLARVATQADQTRTAQANSDARAFSAGLRSWVWRRTSSMIAIVSMLRVSGRRGDSTSPLPMRRATSAAW
jgi:magnesium-transporting ATPase (P-type)